jgi:hypothetical protein
MKEKIIILKNARDRQMVLSRLKDQGVRIKSDMGNMLIVVEPTSKKTITSLSAQGIKFEKPEEQLKTISTFKPEEQLLAKAYLLRKSPAFIKRKKAQVSGESPEEKLIFQAGSDHNS